MLGRVFEQIIRTDDVRRNGANRVAGIRGRVSVASKVEYVVDTTEVTLQRFVYVIWDKLKISAVIAVCKTQSRLFCIPAEGVDFAV